MTYSKFHIRTIPITLLQAVIADLQLIATNCEAYNGPDVLLSKQARKLIGAAVLAVEGTRDKGDQQDPDLGTPGESKKRRRPKTLDWVVQSESKSF